MLLLVFSVADRRYALHLDAVERVVRAVEITPLPEAAENILGVIDLSGRIVPVLSLRRRLGLPDKEVDLGDQLIVAHVLGRPLALLVDGVAGVVDCPEAPAATVPGVEAVEGVVQLEDGLVFVEDLGRLYAPAEG